LVVEFVFGVLKLRLSIVPLKLVPLLLLPAPLGGVVLFSNNCQLTAMYIRFSIDINIGIRQRY
jgi:hypothetical protein